MPIDQDSTFGVCYLSVAEFQASAAMFGITETSMPSEDAVIRSYLAAASRWIEAKTSKNFTPGLDHVETHILDPMTGRLQVNNPPVLSISDYRILTGSSSFSTITLNNLFINNQESWVELLTPPFILPVLSDLIVQITYKSALDIKPNVKLATGYVAAALIQRSESLSLSFPGNIKSIKIGSMAQVTASDKGGVAGIEIAMPPIVELLLASEMTIGIA